MGKITINMIAENTGVSRGTVDRVLHNRPDVSPSVREKVLAAARLMGYLDIPEKDKNDVLIGALLPGNRWFDDHLKKEWKRGLNDARSIVEPLGYRVLLSECETDLPGEIISEAEAFMEQGAVAVIMTGMDIPVIRECVDRLADAGIHVITYNSDIRECKRACFIGQDVYRSGRVAANMLHRHIGAEDQVLAVAGNLKSSGHASRIQGFLDACTEFGIRKEQVKVEESHNDYMLTQSIVEDALLSMPRLKAVYMANENIAGCAAALSGRKEQMDIMVLGNDLTATTRKLLLDGSIDYIIEQNIYWQGYQPVLIAKKLVEFPGFPLEENAFTRINVINAESVRV